MPALKVVLLLFLVIFMSGCGGTRYKQKHSARGIASYYSSKFEGKKTAGGEKLSNKGYTAAANKFRLGACVRVTNRSNGRQIYVRINDRMGNGKRLIDLTQSAADALDFKRQGTAEVKVKVVSKKMGMRRIQKQERR
ncbi:MAG: septal ring lytic transglycosylase RlpA family protein [Taibaiella sp.]|nr:septal ring lytic transglycosylase RlpA family protein [Taibaiella sp.]